jgi:hypothetical protein
MIKEETVVNKSEQSDIELPIICMEEEVVVGTFPIPAGKATKICSGDFWSNFQPATQERRLPLARQSDGQYLRCPRCQGNLGVVGDLRMKDPVKAIGSMGGIRAGSPEAQALARKVKDAKDVAVPIVLGETIVKGG